MSGNEDYPLYLDPAAMRQTKVSLEAKGAVMDIIAVVWWPTKEPFAFDASVIADQLNRVFKRGDYTAGLLEEKWVEIRQFFLEQDDGRWVPSPMFFSLNEPAVEEPS